nr:hypothetical protein [Nitrosomonas nitrosa]
MSLPEVSFQAIFEGVAGNFVYFLLGLGVAGIWRLLSTRFVSRAVLGWVFRPPFTVVIGSPFGIEPGTTTLSRVAGLPIFGFGPLNALHSIWNLLRSAFKKKRAAVPLVTSRTFDRKAFSESLIAIGYPLGNPVTATLLDALKELPIKFDDHKVLDARTGALICEAAYADGVVTNDFGILVIAPNPFNAEARILILAGTETYGVKAAADLLSYEHIRTLYGAPGWVPKWVVVLAAIFMSRSPKNRKVVIVSCQVNGLFVSKPSVVAITRF